MRRSELRSVRRQLGRTLRERKRSLRRQVAERRAALRPPGAARRRRRFWSRVLMGLLLLWLLRDCRCQPPELPEEPPARSGAAAPGAAPVVEAQPRPPPSAPGRIQPTRRPAFDNEALDPLPWLAAYRLQVAARSPRLAECFVGAPNPGTLEWTASVEPSLGRVSDQRLEPTLLSDELTRRQRSCAFAVLSDPPYLLDSAGERATPARVSMVIEF